MIILIDLIYVNDEACLIGPTVDLASNNMGQSGSGHGLIANTP